MRALVLAGGLHFERERPALPTPEGEARIRVTLAGICGTDLQLVQGYKDWGGVPGHEFVGVVERCEVRPELVGRRVVGEINASCGTCPTCRADRRTHCPTRTALGIFGRDGAFADHCTLPAENLYLLPDHITDDAAVFAEPLAAACRILEQVSIDSGDSVVVVGDGRLGQLCAQVLATTDCGLTVLGRHEAKLDLLRARGIAATASPDEAPRGVDLVVEATGSPSGLATSRSLVRPAGTIVLKTTCAAGAAAAALDLTSLVVDEITLIGSRCGPFPRALDLLAHGVVDPTPLIEARYPLERGVEAFEHAARRGSMKVLIET